MREIRFGEIGFPFFPKAMTENLIQHCIEKRRGADEALFRHCFSFLWPTCRTYSQDDQEAMHYLNAGFYKILTGLQKWNRTIPFQNWAKRVVINAIIDDKRKTLKYTNHETILDQIPTRTTESEVTGRFLDEECEYLLSRRYATRQNRRDHPGGAFYALSHFMSSVLTKVRHLNSN